MPTLILSTFSIPAARALAEAAGTAGWDAYAFDENPKRTPRDKAVVYGGVDLVLEIASRFKIAFLEPPLDLLAKLPREFMLRSVEFGHFSDLDRLKGPTFVKPADSTNKVFDAGVYSNVLDIRAPKGIDPKTPVLLAEPVEWNSEYRCFILEGKIAAWSTYISFGRPAWKPFGKQREVMPIPKVLLAFCERLFSRSMIAFPPAFVMDVGQIEERGWAVVEFNPVWCSGLLGADPRQVLPVLERASRDLSAVDDADRAWIVERRPKREAE
jgi:hypothetical protein